jgi:hypothetical protein
LSALDRNLSEKLQMSNNVYLEAFVFCIPAHLFNRMIIVVPMSLCFLLGTYNYNYMLKKNGYHSVGEDISKE